MCALYCQIVDGLLEEQRGGAAVGTTRKGIGPCYSSKATRNGLRVGHLKHFESFKKRLRDTIEVRACWLQSLQLALVGV